MKVYCARSEYRFQIASLISSPQKFMPSFNVDNIIGSIKQWLSLPWMPITYMGITLDMNSENSKTESDFCTELIKILN
uniref:Uncharacterized protein n=1 Tax=Nelumbo nucifera TaxID=4432 RepID=A0A822XHG5_NELNU|nr:TPA_asm: hypothetical protein HUJ06_021140 [Nelumbo nucifera]